MTQTFTLTDSLYLDDLQVYLARAARVEDGAVRLIASDGVLAVYTAILYPRGLLDPSPTVLGLRTFALVPGADGLVAEFDVVVPIRSLLTRVETVDHEHQGVITLSLPMEVNTVTWAAISPPRGGWHPIGSSTGAILDAAARSGIDEVATALPDGAGEQIVRRIRSEVWARPIPGLEHIPAGAGFAALGLGFLGDDEVRIFETGPWTRLTTQRGHILVKRKAWTLAR